MFILSSGQYFIYIIVFWKTFKLNDSSSINLLFWISKTSNILQPVHQSLTNHKQTNPPDWNFVNAFRTARQTPPHTATTRGAVPNSACPTRDKRLKWCFWISQENSMKTPEPYRNLTFPLKFKKPFRELCISATTSRKKTSAKGCVGIRFGLVFLRSLRTCWFNGHFQDVYNCW